MTAQHQPAVAFEQHEIRTDESTRSARLKWVIVVDETLAPGLQVNAAACVAAATGSAIEGLLGPDASDADGATHPGLPWAGCTVLGASPERLTALRVAAVAADETLVVDMPTAAQTTRVYDEYLEVMSRTELAATAPLAVSLIGPRAQVDRLVKKLSLLR